MDGLHMSFDGESDEDDDFAILVATVLLPRRLRDQTRGSRPEKAANIKGQTKCKKVYYRVTCPVCSLRLRGTYCLFQQEMQDGPFPV